MHSTDLSKALHGIELLLILSGHSRYDRQKVCILCFPSLPSDSFNVWIVAHHLPRMSPYAL